MNIGLLGTGNLAVALGTAWARAGHSILLTGRNGGHAKYAAERIGSAAAPVDPTAFAERVEAVVVAITWEGLEEALGLIGAPGGALSGITVMDCTNPVDFTTGRLLPQSGSAAEHIAHLSVGAHVVKALHLFAGASWPFTGKSSEAPVVAICGDSTQALDQAELLITDLGARTARVGGLEAARQSEEVAGFVMRLASSGANPRYAVPNVPQQH